MTLYWWMHWFWITFWVFHNFFVAFGHSLLTTVNYNPTTTDWPTTKLIKLPENNDTGRNIHNIPPKKTNLPVLRNISQYSRNSSIELPSKIDLSPLEASSKSNISEWENNTSKEFTVINHNIREINNTVNLTGFLPGGNRTNPSNHSENITFLGEELSYNQTFAQSEQIGIVLNPEIDTDDNTGNLSAAGITGITLGCIVVVGILCGISFLVYQNQGFNRPQVLNDRCSNPDSSGYIDDASVRDNSEEMYSLDNDSFLNSLEAMTIQNYWTDTVKHTKL